jgi:hypothetical protein
MGSAIIPRSHVDWLCGGQEESAAAADAQMNKRRRMAMHIIIYMYRSRSTHPPTAIIVCVSTTVSHFFSSLINANPTVKRPPFFSNLIARRVFLFASIII